MNNTEDTVVNIVNAEKTYSLGRIDVQALNGVNLNIIRGDFVAIMGPSGSGKSTLMNLIGCLDRPTKGDIFINNRNINIMTDSDLANLRGKEIGFVFQTFNLIQRLSALKNVELPMVYQDIPRDSRIIRAQWALNQVELGDRMDHKPNELSGGECQRVAIARALVNDPSILLADEPTGNLDSKTEAEIMRIFQKLNDEGRTIVMVTHEPELGRQAKRIVRLRDGRIEGEEIYEN